MSVATRQWVRTHTIAGYVVGRFAGEYEGAQRDLIAVQTVDGITVVPATAVLPVDEGYVQRQVALDLERVIRSIVEGGLTFDEADQAWHAALDHVQAAARRQASGAADAGT